MDLGRLGQGSKRRKQTGREAENEQKTEDQIQLARNGGKKREEVGIEILGAD